jgi:hypothetical protein
MLPRTIFLSRLLGLYCILVAVAMTVQKQATLDSVTALLRNPPMLLMLGVFTTAAGLAMVLAHNIWSGGALTVIVTVAGWLALIKGVLFLVLPPQAQAEFFLKGLAYQQLFYVYMAITLGLGIYLTYGGFRSTARL